MREIELTQGQVTLVSDEDYETLSRFQWRLLRSRSGFYAHGRIETSDGYWADTYMHRFIIGARRGQYVDHINHDSLDNRRENLRLCTRSQNNQNTRKRAGGSSQYKGVSFFPRVNGWKVRVTMPRLGGGKGTERHVGLFYDEKEAARAYNRVAREVYGEFAVLNEVEDG